MFHLASFNDRSESKYPKKQVVSSPRLASLLLGCLLVWQSVAPFAVLAATRGASSASGASANAASGRSKSGVPRGGNASRTFFSSRDKRSLAGAKEAAEILGVRKNVDRILELQAAGGEPSEELLWNKAIVLKQILLGYLEVRQTSDMLDESIDETYDAIDKHVRKVNRRVDLANTVNFTTFGVLFNIAAADRLKRQFDGSNELTFISASLTAGLGALAVGLSYTGSSIDRGRPNPLSNIFGLDKVSVPLPELVGKYIDGTPSGGMQTRKAAMLELWKTKFNVKDSRESHKILAAESTKRHYATLKLLNQRLGLLFSLNALAEQFDSELLALLRLIETNSAPTLAAPNAVVPSEEPGAVPKRGVTSTGEEPGAVPLRGAMSTDGEPSTSPDAPPAAVSPASETISGSVLANSHIGASGIEAAKLLRVEQFAASIINTNKTNSRNGEDLQTLALDLYVLEKILGAALEVRQLVDRIDQEKHYQFDILLPQLVRVRDRVNLMTNTATFTEIGVLKNIAGGAFVRQRNQAGTEMLLTMDAIAVLFSTANLAYLKLYRHKQDSDVNTLANIFKFDMPSDYQFTPLISSYLEGVPPESTSGNTRKQQLLAHWKENGILPRKENGLVSRKERTKEVLASVPSQHDKRVETIELVNKRVRMLFDLKGTVETFDLGLLELLTAIILPASEKNAGNRVDTQLALIKRTMQNALEIRSSCDQIDNQLSREYTAKEAILAARSRGIQYNNILNFTQSGTLGVVAQGLTLNNLQNQANTLDLISGSAVLLLSSAALLQQRMGKRPTKPELNMLAQVLVPGVTPKEYIPPSVLNYLNSPAVPNGLTRRESLIERWKSSGVITTKLRSTRNLRKLSACDETSRKESVQLITDRIVMLHDVQTMIESMDKQLVTALREDH